MFQRLILFALPLALLFTACNRGDGPDTETGPTDAEAQSSASSQNILNDAFLVADQSMDEAGVNKTATICADFTLDTVARTLLVDFGSGCTSSNGVTRSGTILVNYIGRHRQPGSQFSLTLNNYTVNGTSVSGALNVTSIALNAQGKMSFSYSVSNASVTYQATTYSISCQNTVTWDSGAGNGNPNDDVFLIEGSSAGSNGTDSYTSTITSPIRIDASCATTSGAIPTSGTVQIQPSTQRSPYTLDFGNGTCDRSFTVTFRTLTRTITL